MTSNDEESSVPFAKQTVEGRSTLDGSDTEDGKKKQHPHPQQQHQMYSNVADLYHKFRPRYPNEFIDEAIETSSRLRSSNGKGRILEIGCGPGTLTLPLAQRGYDIVAIDPGSGMITKAREVCQNFPNAEFHRVGFKDYVQKVDDLLSFDAIFAASSLHWAMADDEKPDTSIQKMARLLKDGGDLILFWNFPLEPENEVLEEVAKALNRPIPFYFGIYSIEEHLQNLQERVLSPIERSGYFSEFETKARTIDEKIPIQSYIGFLNTLSNYITMKDDEREVFCGVVSETLQRCGDGGENIPTSRKSMWNVCTKLSK